MTTMLSMEQMTGETMADHVARLKGLSSLAEESIREARELQQHCIEAYKRAVKSDAPKPVLRACGDANFKAAAQMARAKKRRDDVEYALFEALQLWDGEG